MILNFPLDVQPYSLPKDVARVVSLVDDIMRFPSIRRSRIEVAPVEQPVYLNSSVGAAPFGNTCPTKCATFTTPAVLEAQYKYSPLTTTPNAKSQVAVAEFQFQYWDQADLDSFNTNCGTKVIVFLQFSREPLSFPACRFLWIPQSEETTKRSAILDVWNPCSTSNTLAPL